MCVNKEIKHFRDIEKEIFWSASLGKEEERICYLPAEIVKQKFPKLKEKVNKDGKYESNCGIIVKENPGSYSFRYFRK